MRRFLENHGNGIEAVVFAVTETEEVCGTSVKPADSSCSSRETLLTVEGCQNMLERFF